MANNESVSIKKYLVRDKHGNQKKAGSLAVVGSVNVEVDSTGGDHPTAESTYQNGQLDITLHDIKGERGNGITEIDVEESQVDDAYNVVRIHCTDDESEEGTELRVKNGKRGNGITGIVTAESQVDGGNNTVTIKTTDNPTGVTFNVKNGTIGPVGPQGATSVYDETTQNFLTTLETTTGQSQTATMTQKAVTDLLSEYVGMPLSQLSSASLDTSTDTIKSATSTQVCDYCQVSAGDDIKVEATYTESKSIRIAFTENLPAVGSSVQDLVEVYASAVNRVFTAPTSGYIVINRNQSYFTDLKVSLGKMRLDGIDSNVKNLTVPLLHEMSANGFSSNSQGQLAYDFSTKKIYCIKGSYNGNMLKQELSLSDGTEVHYLGLPFAWHSSTGLSLMKPYVLDNLVGTVYDGKLVDSSGAILSYANGKASVFDIPKGVDTVFVSGRISSSNTCLCSAVDDSDSVIGVFQTAYGTAQEYNNFPIKLPSGTKKIRVNGHKTYFANISAKAPVIPNATSRIIRPKLRLFETMESDSNAFANTFYRTLACTPRYIKTSKSFYLTVERNCRYVVNFYDKSFNLLGTTRVSGAAVAINANTPTLISADYGFDYVKVMLANVSGDSSDFKLQDFTLEGEFDDDWDTFNVRPSNGYQRIIATVNVTNPNSCDMTTEETSGVDNSTLAEVQDIEQYYPDYGVLALPARYTHDGEPTRLIIYCHGAAVNYSTSVAQFDTDDIDPTYWLAEGYAVMDVEGNPFNNDDEHMCTPQAMDCYVAAYKWVIEHYNIKRDGVFLGGRSMGAANTLGLIAHGCHIPIIAACPNATAAPSFGYGVADRKKYVAVHAGFLIPPVGSEFDDEAFRDGDTDENISDVADFVFSAGDSPEAEVKLIKYNFEKYLKCLPQLDIITDLPDKDTLYDWLLGDKSNGYGFVWNEFATATSNLHAHASCPVKFFSGYQDPTRRINQALYNMLCNSGCYCEMRVFDDRGHDYGSASMPGHHCDLANTYFRTTFTTRYGEELSNVPMFYIEMLQFWRRYEQE